MVYWSLVHHHSQDKGHMGAVLGHGVAKDAYLRVLYLIWTPEMGALRLQSILTSISIHMATVYQITFDISKIVLLQIYKMRRD